MSTITSTSPSQERTVIRPSDAAVDENGRSRTYQVRTFGCQMNVHDSERLSGSLEAAGYVPADGDEADIVVINTCAVRENADNKLYGNLGHLASVKRRHAGMQIAVGGCLAQKDKNVILDKAPWVDVVFGTHNMGSLPALLERARHNDEAQIEILDALETFPSTLPTKRDSSYSGWVLSRSDATTPARSASCRPCAARRRTGAPARSSPKFRRSLTTGSSR
jgi:tRNA-2-methylthio-N6-dimethylallyladenosine synthase